jgi:ribonuclease VapC
MMVIDTSAVIAILRLEPEADAFMRAIAAADACSLSAVSAMEAALVLAGSRPDSNTSPTASQTAWAPLDQLLSTAAIEIVPFDEVQAHLARSAFARFGKGRHPAALNLGDCASYALAATRNLPLLFKGGDFAKTDLVAAVPLLFDALS